jgi:large subunit ribosomal protein L11
MVTIKIIIESNKASMTPPIGPILGQHGIPGQKFCLDFNEQTKTIKQDTNLMVKLFRPLRTEKKTMELPRYECSILRSKLLTRCVEMQPIQHINIRRIYHIALMVATHPKLHIYRTPTSEQILKISKSLISTANSMGIPVKN